MNTQNLNLARKWRSKNFDQIVGQELSIRMLKNSLYLDQYFPVYLFSGQKGCGKTSTARVFAAAINCERLVAFQKDHASQAVPCLICPSCRAIATGKHPDFIEIDAASHTGVDNVRQIIDSAGLLPLMARKKIYLIDEAHMLSKAAFNAFLKLMEEPPSTVIFILATTDTQKIIETVRSRCFAVYFRPVEQKELLTHLIAICDAESISYDEHALTLIIKETNGSVRDALNLLEQVRFSDSHVSKEAVYNVLGQLDEERLLRLFETVLHKSGADFLRLSQEIELEKFSAEFIWKQLTELVRACIWIKNGIVPRNFSAYTSQLQFLTQRVSLGTINGILELFYRNEAVFRKTAAQHAFLEILLLRICKKNESNSNSSMPAAMVSSLPLDEGQELEALDENGDDDSDGDSQETPVYEDENTALWATFVTKIELLHDPLLTSIFKQGVVDSYDPQSEIIRIAFPKQLTFFSDLIQSTKPQWQPLLEQIRGKRVEIEPLFTREALPGEKQTPVMHKSPPLTTVQKTAIASEPRKVFTKSTSYRPQAQSMPINNEQRLDVADAQAWPQAALLLKYFPGTITQLRDESL